MESRADLPEPPPLVPAEYSPVREHKPLWKRFGGAIVAAAILIVNFGAKLKGLLLLLPKIKVLSTSATALVSVAAYALIWTWKFALGFVILLFIHEMGHVIQLRREGIKASAPMFIPFVGAVVAMKELPKDAAAEARVGLAGPVFGALGCLIPLALYGATGDELFKALTYIGFFLNLINMLPVLPLDGGRAMAALSPWIWLVGYGILVGLTFAFPNPIMVLVLLLGGFETYRRWKARKSPESQRYHQVRPRTRVLIALTYVALAAVLAIGMDASFVERDFDDV